MTARALKRFTVSEAESLIPELERIFETISELIAQAEVKAAELRRRQDGPDGDTAAAVIERSQIQFLAHGVDGWLSKVADLGALPKGVNPALVDFPHRLDGRDVYLCWRLGETKITHYHAADEGFSNRRPLKK